MELFKYPCLKRKDLFVLPETTCVHCYYVLDSVTTKRDLKIFNYYFHRSASTKLRWNWTNILIKLLIISSRSDILATSEQTIINHISNSSVDVLGMGEKKEEDCIKCKKSYLTKTHDNEANICHLNNWWDSDSIDQNEDF